MRVLKLTLAHKGLLPALRLLVRAGGILRTAFPSTGPMPA